MAKAKVATRIEKLQVKQHDRKQREPKATLYFEGVETAAAYELADKLIEANEGLDLNEDFIEKAGDTRSGENAVTVRLEMPEGTPRSQRKTFTVWHSGKGQASGFGDDIVKMLEDAGATNVHNAGNRAQAA